MAANRVWVRGIPGRLTRIDKRGDFLPVDEWRQATMSRRIQMKADRGSLEISYKDPSAKKPKPAATATKEKEAEA